MRSLSIPIPVVLFIRRLFNVFSSLTISNQYYILTNAEPDCRTDGNGTGNLETSRRRETSPVRPEAKAVRAGQSGNEQSTSRGSFISYAHWGRIKSWPWSMPAKQPVARSTHTTLTEETLPQRSLEKDHEFNEKQGPTNSPSAPDPDSPPPRSTPAEKLSPIKALMLNPLLFDPIRAPRYPIVLCHGLYGYDVRGPSFFPMLQLHYWANVLKVLKKKIGAEVIVTGVPGTGSIESRARRLNEYLQKRAQGRDINFIAHSMGGLDCRHLISHVKPTEYNPASLTTICTPHRGSPFMDWCIDNIGIGKFHRQVTEASRKASETTNSLTSSLASLPSSLTTLLLSVLDSPAYANLSTYYLQNVFNPATPDDPRVRYYSVAARTNSMSVLHALWLPKTILDGVEAREREVHPHPEQEEWGNDGLVSVRSARWGESLGILEGCDHWDVRGGWGLGADSEWNVDLVLPSALKNSLSDPLSHVNVTFWKDWVRLMGAWRKEEEQREKDADSRKTSLNVGGLQAVEDSRASRKEGSRDEVVQSSTDKLSAVFDWISEQVPLPSRQSSSKDVMSPSDSSSSQSPSDIQPSPSRTASSPSAFTSPSARKVETGMTRVDAKKAAEAGDGRLKFDLERFYIALSRKLYEDGL